jgi:hypothetical protein
MQFMVALHLDPAKAKTPPTLEFAQGESQAIRGLYLNGLIRQIWAHADSSGALMIVEAPSAEGVAERIGALPMVRGGYSTSPAIVPLAPSWGFAPRS